MIWKKHKNNVLKYIFICLLALSFFLIYKIFDINFIGKLFEDNSSLFSSRIYSIILIFILRSVSIVIPILPGTYCSVIAGYLLGVRNGLILMFISDFIACSLSFFVSRRFGRNFVGKLLGQRQMKSIEKISQKYLENNFFLISQINKHIN